MSDFRNLVIDRATTHSTLTLNRPDKRNALNAELRDEIVKAIAELEKEHHVIILTGNGPGFCAGLDLSEKPDVEALEGMWAVASAIYKSEAVFIAAVNGSARGGGLTIVNACDLAIASERASFGMPEAGFGVYPSVVGPTTQLAINKKPAAWMVLTAMGIDAQAALQADIVNQVVSADKLMSEAEKLAAHLSGLDKIALTASKKALNTYPYTDAIRDEAVHFGTTTNVEIQRKREQQEGANQ